MPKKTFLVIAEIGMAIMIISVAGAYFIALLKSSHSELFGMSLNNSKLFALFWTIFFFGFFVAMFSTLEVP